jgi:hypothetical protein
MGLVYRSIGLPLVPLPAVPVPDGARQLSGATPVTSLAALPGWQEVMGRVTWRKNDLLEQTGITIFNGKIWENHHFLWENYGKLWKITIFNGKATKNYGKSPCY